ncbi:MAG: DNA translocase FtsK, partial [Clostridia bacterium]|nr:DNA translocase FtsK [Clostridia bacterium]
CDVLENDDPPFDMPEKPEKKPLKKLKRPEPKPEVEEEEEPYNYPPIDLLAQGEQVQTTKKSGDDDREKADKLIETLHSFGIETRLIGVAHGPVVTRFELQPAPGVKVSRISSLQDDIAMHLAAMSVRIEAPIPGKAAVGIEVPNTAVAAVYIREVLDNPVFANAGSPLSFVLGRDIGGNPVVSDIGSMPHLLIAGATGSGKSVCINTLIISLLYKSSPEDVRLLMVDPKVVELGVYNGIPHLLIPVVTEPKKAAGALGWAVAEMTRRYNLFAEHKVRDIKGYNAKVEEQSFMEGELETDNDFAEPRMEKLPNIVIIIDELADLMMVAPKDVEDHICRLAQMARAAGMHLVIATQRPSVDVITGIIKANIPSRIAFKVSSQVDSRTILDVAGAEKLLGKGDMLYYPVGAAKPQRMQGAFITESEVEAVVKFVKGNYTAVYQDDIIEHIENGVSAGNNDDRNEEDEMDEQFYEALEACVESGQASATLLQRKIKVGYARAARIIDQLEDHGYVGPDEGSKPRTVLITRDELSELLMRRE